MMMNIKTRIFSVMAMTTILLTSCGEPDAVIYEPNNEQALFYFEDTAAQLPVNLDDSGSIAVNVLTTSVASTDRTIEIVYDSDNSSLDESLVRYSNTVTIPANEYSGTFNVEIDDSENVTTEFQSLIFELENTSESISTASNDRLTVSFFQVCPIPDTYFVGDYLVEDVDAVVGPDNGTENFESGIYTIVAASVTSRTFVAPVLPAFAGEERITIDLICNTFVLNQVDPGLTCDGGDNSYIFDNAQGASTYDLSDDTTFLITYTEDPQGSCGGPFTSSVRFTKQ